MSDPGPNSVTYELNCYGAALPPKKKEQYLNDRVTRIK